MASPLSRFNAMFKTSNVTSPYVRNNGPEVVKSCKPMNIDETCDEQNLTTRSGSDLQHRSEGQKNVTLILASPYGNDEVDKRLGDVDSNVYRSPICVVWILVSFCEDLDQSTQVRSIT